MQYSQSHISEILSAHGIRPSAQRIAVMKAMVDNRIHPTAEQIFDILSPQMPTLSLTTVYNTLRLMAEKGVISVLAMDRRFARFDYSEKPHSHVWCRVCGNVADVWSTVSAPDSIAGFRVDEVEVCYKGVCPKCAAATPQN